MFDWARGCFTIRHDHDLPQKLTILHDFDEDKFEKLTTKLTKSFVICGGVIVIVVVIIGGIARYCLAAHRQPAKAAPEVAAAPEVDAAPDLLRIAISNISYIRRLFPDNYFKDKSVHKSVPVMKIKDLMPMDAESRRMIDWMEKGVNDALQKKYLKTLLFCVCKEVGGPMIEEYAFSFSYSNSESQEVSMNVNRIGNKRQGGTFSSTEITPNQMRISVCKIGALVHLIGTLDEMPEERTIFMKLLYYDDVTPLDYEPPCFICCTEEVNNVWTKNQVKMKVDNVNSKHLFALEVKSVLDSSWDDSDVIQVCWCQLGGQMC